MTSSQLKKFADVQEGPRGGHFVVSSGGLKRYGTPKPGEKFIVYRVGGKDEVSLRGRNAGNADGVANYISEQQDFDGPSNGNLEHDPHIHAYEVTVDKPFGRYEMQTGGPRGNSGVGSVGRQMRGKKDAEIIYSFPSSGFTEKHLGAIPLAKVERHIPPRVDDWGHGPVSSPGSFMMSGQLKGAAAIRAAFGHEGDERGEK